MVGLSTSIINLYQIHLTERVTGPCVVFELFIFDNNTNYSNTSVPDRVGRNITTVDRNVDLLLSRSYS